MLSEDTVHPLVTEATETPQFIGRSYLVYNNKDILKRYAPSIFQIICIFHYVSTNHVSR